MSDFDDTPDEVRLHAARVGTLTHGLAHELGTPLQFLGDSLSFVADCLRELTPLLSALDAHAASRALRNAHPEVNLTLMVEELPAAVDQARDGVRRLVEMVQALRSVVAPDLPGPVPVDLSAAVRDVLLVARHEWKYHWRLEPNLTSPALARSTPGALRLGLLELLLWLVRRPDSAAGLGLLRASTACAGDVVIATLEVDSAVGQQLPPRLHQLLVNAIDGVDLVVTTTQSGGVRVQLMLPADGPAR